MYHSATMGKAKVTRKAFESTELVRWIPGITMMLLNTLSYIDRNTLALLAPTILRETHLSNEQYGFIISGFSIAYMLFNPLWGRIVDRWGVRMSMTTAVSLWTVASVSHAFAAGFFGFLVARTVLGAGEGATCPGAVSTVTQTFPPSKRMRGIGIAYSGASLGALLTPIIITPIAVAWGWRAAFWFTGAAGVFWLALWGLVLRRADLARSAAHVETRKRPRWNDARLWALIGAYALGGTPVAFVLYQAPIYLSAALHKSQLEIGQVLWLPPLGWEIGWFFWGWVADRFAWGGASIPALRRQFLLLLLLTLPLAAVPHIASYPITVAMLFSTMFGAAGFGIAGIAYATRIYTSTFSGFIAGALSGTWSAAVALVMPVVGRLFDLHRYNAAFALATLLPIAGYVVWRTLHCRTEPTSKDLQG
jgi:MFS transporter, ACS family, hexuronate transporter